MCTGIEIALIAGSMTASVAGGVQAKKASDKQAQAIAGQAAYDANMTLMSAADQKRASIDEADKILSNAVAVRSAQTAQQATSGLALGSGSAQVLQDNTTKLATADALATLVDGGNRYASGSAQSRNIRMAGEANANAASAQGNAALLSGISQAIGTGAANYKYMKTR